MKQKYTLIQKEESMATILCITFSGGFQDAYSYFARGKVFANAQTGNIVLMASHFFDLDFFGGMKYLVPLLFFALGVFTAEQIEGNHKEHRSIHWRQMVLLAEVVLLFASGFLSQDWNLLVNSMISFACAMQVQAFRKWNGNAYASTMCIGNLRSGMANLSAYLRTHEKKTLHSAAYYFEVIFIFFLGAGIGYIAVAQFGLHAIWFSSLILLVATTCMWNLNTK